MLCDINTEADGGVGREVGVTPEFSSCKASSVKQDTWNTISFLPYSLITGGATGVKSSGLEQGNLDSCFYLAMNLTEEAGPVAVSRDILSRSTQCKSEKIFLLKESSSTFFVNLNCFIKLVWRVLQQTRAHTGSFSIQAECMYVVLSGIEGLLPGNR